ncbi:TolC family protein [uncultured Roseivirga sp.]|mgnify:CR=1 FL=1|uniref:TolC family protein n=1 Tax=uncultured Roseivirga sp. TaxID=543088 RepID=UPI0030DA5C7B|tara:strand:+ start:50946 stop:52394 length:1449 start_codon:yes stop_codon:yes gene_type:complete
MIWRRKIYLSLAGLFMLVASYGQQNSWTLEECINFAWQNNLTVRSSELNKLNSEIALKESKFALLPSLSGGGNLSKSFGRTIDPVTNGFISTSFVSSGVSASSSVTLFNGGALRNTIKRNELNLDASEFDLQKAKNDIGVTVATNFLNVLLGREQLKNATFQLESSQAQLERTKKLVNAGSLPMTSQLDLESQVATNEVSVVNAENGLRSAVLSLKQAMQMPADEPLEVEAPEVSVDNMGFISQSPNEIYNIAMGVQPEIQSAELGVKSSEVGVALAKSAFLPSLSLSGSISTNHSGRARQLIGTQQVTTPAREIGFVQGSNESVFSNPSQQTVPIYAENYGVFNQYDDNLGQSVSIRLSVPIFSRYSNSANLQRAKIAKQRAEITSLTTRNQLRQSIESAYNSALAALNTYNATLKRVTALEESFRATEQRYNVGDVNNLDYQIASNNLFSARADLIRNKYEYIFRTKILDFYLGNPITLQ